MHRYVANNQKMCWLAVQAIETGCLAELSDAICDSQRLFDDCAIDNCPNQLKSPKLHSVMADTELR